MHCFFLKKENPEEHIVIQSSSFLLFVRNLSKNKTIPNNRIYYNLQKFNKKKLIIAYNDIIKLWIKNDI